MNTYYIIKIHFISNSIKLKLKLEMEFIFKKNIKKKIIYVYIKFICMVIINL